MSLTFHRQSDDNLRRTPPFKTTRSRQIPSLQAAFSTRARRTPAASHEEARCTQRRWREKRTELVTGPGTRAATRPNIDTHGGDAFFSLSRLDGRTAHRVRLGLPRGALRAAHLVPPSAPARERHTRESTSVTSRCVRGMTAGLPLLSPHRVLGRTAKEDDADRFAFLFPFIRRGHLVWAALVMRDGGTSKGFWGGKH